MLKQSLKIILRYLIKNKFYASTLIIGFSFSFSVASLLIVYLVRETTTDQFHKKYKNIYRIMMNDPVSMKNGIITFHQLPLKLTTDFPEIEVATHLYYPKRTKIYKGNTLADDFFEEHELFYADERFLTLFNFELKQGSQKSALKDSKSIVLTEKTAIQYFGSKDVLGKVLYIKQEPYTITGVLGEQIGNSHFKFNLLISKTSLKPSNFALDYAGLTYIRVNEKASEVELANKLNGNQNNFLPFEPEQPLIEPFKLQPLSDIYFYQDGPAFLSNILRSGNRESINMLLLVTIIILTLSVFNYLNFSQSKALFSAKENAVKLIFGASKRVLKLHVVVEAFVVVFVSLIISSLIVLLITPLFNQIFNTDIGVYFFSNSAVIVVLGFLIVSITLILALISYQVVSGSANTNMQMMQMRTTTKGSRIIDGIFVIQLTGSTILLTIALIVLNQVSFLKNHSPGYDTKGIIEINLMALPKSVSLHSVKSAINKVPGVLTSTLTHGSPLTGRWTTGVKVNGVPFEMGSYSGDEDFIKTFNIQILEGRDFSKEIASDTNAILINETGKKLLQLDDNFEPRDKTIRLSTKVIGVVKDFHYASMKEKVGPVLIGYSPFRKIDDFGGVKLSVSNSTLSYLQIAELKKTLYQIAPELPFEYLLLEDKYKSLHSKENNQLNMILAGGTISLMISVFGLVGLSLFLSARKIKEIAIRKTLGASTLSVTIMFMKRLLVLVLISFILSIPLSWTFVSKWLSEFVYKTNVTPMTWITAIMLMILITTVSVFQLLFQAARKNPAVSLKRE